MSPAGTRARRGIHRQRLYGTLEDQVRTSAWF